MSRANRIDNERVPSSSDDPWWLDTTGNEEETKQPYVVPGDASVDASLYIEDDDADTAAAKMPRDAHQKTDTASTSSSWKDSLQALGNTVSSQWNAMTSTSSPSRKHSNNNNNNSSKKKKKKKHKSHSNKQQEQRHHSSSRPQRHGNVDDDASSLDSAVLQLILAQEAEAAAAQQFKAAAPPVDEGTVQSASQSVTQRLSNIWQHTKQTALSATKKKKKKSQSDREAPPRRSSTKSTLNRVSSSGSRTSESTHSTSSFRKYTMKELIRSMEDDNENELPPALERRVRDFQFAQGKRRDRHGDNKPWGIFGLYAHLSDIRADLEWAEDAAWRRQKGEPYLSWTDFEKTRDQGLHNRPWFTYGTIALCSLMFVITWAINGWRFEPLNVNPLIGPSSDTLIKVGARQTDLIVNEGQWFRLFTPLILHAGLVHFCINMAAVYFLGTALEQSHGALHAAVLFIIPAVGGNILSAICLPQYISVGASGGIFGLIGGCLADISINWHLLFLKSTTDEKERKDHLKVLFWLAFDIIINCVIGFTPFVDNFTHLGGFLYGLCCGLSTMDRLAVGFFGLQKKSDNKAWNSFVRFLGLIVSVLGIMITTVILVQSDGTTSPCHGCRYISCVPFPPRAEDKWWYCDDCDFVTADLFIDQETNMYQDIDLTCPDQQVVSINVAPDEIYDREELRRELPTYCRLHCDQVFANY